MNRWDDIIEGLANLLAFLDQEGMLDTKKIEAELELPKDRQPMFY